MRKPGYFPFNNPKIPRYVSRSLSKIRCSRRKSMRIKPGWHPQKFKQSSMISVFGYGILIKPFKDRVASVIRSKVQRKKRDVEYGQRWNLVEKARNIRRRMYGSHLDRHRD